MYEYEFVYSFSICISLCEYDIILIVVRTRHLMVYILFFLNKFIYLFMYFWLCWVFVPVRGLSVAGASGGHSSSRCAGLSLSRPLLLHSTGSRRTGLVVVPHGPSCSTACGIFPDQGSNPYPLHWQADSQPLHHQGSPGVHSWTLFFRTFLVILGLFNLHINFKLAY